MIKFDTKTCLVIVSKDAIKYEIRVSNVIAFGSPCPFSSNQILKYYKYKLLTTKYAYIKLSLFCMCRQWRLWWDWPQGMLRVSISLLLTVYSRNKKSHELAHYYKETCFYLNFISLYYYNFVLIWAVTWDSGVNRIIMCLVILKHK